jgi:hypothetical protein
MDFPRDLFKKDTAFIIADFLRLVENFTHKKYYNKKFKYGYNCNCRGQDVLNRWQDAKKMGPFAGGPFFISPLKIKFNSLSNLKTFLLILVNFI